MKKTLIITFILISKLFFCQSTILEYEFEVKNNMLNKTFIFPAVLSINPNKTIIYTVNFGIANQINQNDKKSALIDTSFNKYILFSDKTNIHLLKDKINDDIYYFKDEYTPIHYTFKKEFKIVKNIKLTKAEAEFRGRKFIFWLETNTKITGGPWKFNNLPGIAHEIYEENGLFRWNLISFKNNQKTVENPFKDVKDFISFNEYPKMRYSLTQEQIENLKSVGNTIIKEQPRNGLEKEFEWEK